jgi:hypothetical protein
MFQDSAVVAAEFRGGEAIGGEVRALTAIRLRHADSEQALAVHVVEVLDGEARLAVVSGRAGG